MNYSTLANQESLQKTTQALQEKGYVVDVVKTGAEALEKIKMLIPENASVMNGSSVTLETIGFVDYLKSDQHRWNNLHAAIVAEQDPAKQAHLRKQAELSDYYLGSVHALVETGEFVIASNTGSQLPHVVYTSPNLIFVVSTKKIVADLTNAMNRLHEYIMPLEDQHMKEKYNVGTAANKVLIFNGENPMFQRKINFILVEESLGF